MILTKNTMDSQHQYPVKVTKAYLRDKYYLTTKTVDRTLNHHYQSLVNWKAKRNFDPLETMLLLVVLDGFFYTKHLQSIGLDYKPKQLHDQIIELLDARRK